MIDNETILANYGILLPENIGENTAVAAQDQQDGNAEGAEEE